MSLSYRIADKDGMMPVRNTFIHFDVYPSSVSLPQARSATCPPRFSPAHCCIRSLPDLCEASSHQDSAECGDTLSIASWVSTNLPEDQCLDRCVQLGEPKQQVSSVRAPVTQPWQSCVLGSSVDFESLAVGIPDSQLLAKRSQSVLRPLHELEAEFSNRSKSHTIK